jgi:hypothetical protein
VDHKLKVSFDTEVNHLGVLIGDTSLKRIVSLSTSGVFVDKTLIPGFWTSDNFSVDSGFQGHLYTREQDSLVVRIPSTEYPDIEKIKTAIALNFKIWNSFVGIRLVSAESPITLVSDHLPSESVKLPGNITWFTGNMNDATRLLFNSSKFSYLAFIFSTEVLQDLGLYNSLEDNYQDIANHTSLLMDKNECMELLQEQVNFCARSYPFNNKASAAHLVESVPTDRAYVFKPSGGAAGIGLFPLNLIGTGIHQIAEHVDLLRQAGNLPVRFQIQEFIPGNIYGCSACFLGNGRYEVLEIHEQMINSQGRCTGSRWNSEIAAAKQELVFDFYRQIASIKQLNPGGLICLDFIQDKVIEVNPRIAASAPIAHILRMRNLFRSRYGDDFNIHQIDLNTNISVPYEMIRNGKFWDLVLDIWNDHRVMCLPQGINPFGSSRMVFINDDSGSTYQKLFLKSIS